MLLVFWGILGVGGQGRTRRAREGEGQRREQEGTEGEGGRGTDEALELVF
jgi:hypothetical protein